MTRTQLFEILLDSFMKHNTLRTTKLDEVYALGEIISKELEKRGLLTPETE